MDRSPAQYAFVMTKGTDTLVVERVTMGRASVSAEMAMRGQATLTFIALLIMKETREVSLDTDPVPVSP